MMYKIINNKKLKHYILYDIINNKKSKIIINKIKITKKNKEGVLK